MNQVTRRRTLRGVGAFGVVALAGCSDSGGDPDPGNGNDGDDTGDDGTGNDDGTNGDANGTNDGDAVEIHHVAVDRSGSAWDYRDRPGFCAFVRDPGDASWLFDEEDAETAAFVDATDFESSVLLYVESVGPNICYNALSVTDVAVEDGTVVGNAAAVDTSDEDADVCGPSLTYPGALIRITTDPLPDAARIAITDGWGNTAEMTPEDGLIDPASLPGTVRPDGDPRTVPAALDCDEEGFERHYAGYRDEVAWGSTSGVDGTPGLELRVVDPDGDGTTAFARGDEVRVELTNVAAAPIGTGNLGMYNVEVYAEDGWTEVRGGEGQFEYTEELLLHPPGETVAWTLEMTEEGVVAEHQYRDHLRVCPDLRPGRYRFVFWGTAPVAVAFDYEG
ncbi:hypothetical protein [Halorubrum sp. DTA98]|uniref:hypothetical protein n=1 Tax=Halorubrum sp. DTA98 TaxID=3402163 RepID=UPI003AAFBE83